MRASGRFRTLLVGLPALLACVVALPAAAQQEQFRVRGTIEQVKGESLVVATRTGEVMGFALKDDTGVFVVRPAALEDVEAGDFVGLTSIESGGKRVALEAHVFAEDLRGIGEGHYAWDLIEEPNTMTNATVAEVDEVGMQRELQLTYAEGEGEAKTTGTQTIYVPDDVPIVRLEKRDERALLEAGKEVFLMVQGPRDGIPTVNAAVVGIEGATPPM